MKQLRRLVRSENHPPSKERVGVCELRNGVKRIIKQPLCLRAHLPRAPLLSLGICSLLAIAMLAIVSSCGSTDSEPYRTIDGSGNNLRYPQMNQVGVQLVRLAPPAYADGISSFAGADRPNPRDISNIVNNEDELIPNPDSATNFVW